MNNTFRTNKAIVTLFTDIHDFIFWMGSAGALPILFRYLFTIVPKCNSLMFRDHIFMGGFLCFLEGNLWLLFPRYSCLSFS